MNNKIPIQKHFNSRIAKINEKFIIQSKLNLDKIY